MRIKKTSNTRAIAGKVVNVESDSTTDAYSCDYVNGAIRKSKNETLSNEANIDNITSSGVYGIFNATGTLPSGYTSDNNIFIHSMVWGNGNYGRQVLYDIRSNNIYTRQKSHGTWNSWVSLL